MKYVPHDYQQYATDYIETHPISAVLLDMGLGKTAITLTALLNLLFDSFEAHRVLVIAPLRVARDTWPAEIEKWDHLQILTYSVAVGTEKERKSALMRPADIYIINRENVQWLIEQSGLPFDFDTVIVDELSSFKSHQSKRFKAYVFHADTEGLNFRRAFADAGFYLSGCCIWKKNSLVLGRSPYQWIHEPVLFGWKKSGKHEWYAGRKETTVWEYDKPKKNGDHPTMKPIALLAYPIMNSSMSNTLVLDPFGGSGSTLIACEQSDRSCYTIELDEKFCDVIVKRYIEQVGSADGVSLQRDGLTYAYEDVSVIND